LTNFHGVIDYEEIEARNADYSFKELQQWYDIMAYPVLKIDGVTATGISISKNKLSIGVKTEEVIEKVECTLKALEIALEAADIRVTGEVILD
jgi:hypothetical protein